MTSEELIEYFGLPRYRKVESPVRFAKPGEQSVWDRMEQERDAMHNDELVERIGGYGKLYTPKKKPCLLR